MRVYNGASDTSEKSVNVTVVSSDDISCLSDDELGNKFSAIKRRIDHGRKKHVKHEVLRALEVEFCYLHREIGIRDARRRAHDKFVEERGGRRNRNRTGGR